MRLSYVRILKFGKKLDSDKLYRVAKKTVTHCLSVHLFVHISFSPMKISVTDFLAPIGASVFTFCVHLQVDKVYCENENQDAYFHFAFFFQFFNFPSVTPIKYIWTFFLSKISQQLLDLGFWNLVQDW